MQTGDHMGCNTSHPLAPLVSLTADQSADTVLYAGVPDAAVRVYLVLSERGPLSRRAIMRQLGRPRGTVERAVRALAALGVVEDIERPAGEQ